MCTTKWSWDLHNPSFTKLGFLRQADTSKKRAWRRVTKFIHQVLKDEVGNPGRAGYTLTKMKPPPISPLIKATPLIHINPRRTAARRQHFCDSLPNFWLSALHLWWMWLQLVATTVSLFWTDTDIPGCDREWCTFLFVVTSGYVTCFFCVVEKQWGTLLPLCSWTQPSHEQWGSRELIGRLITDWQVHQPITSFGLSERIGHVLLFQVTLFIDANPTFNEEHHVWSVRSVSCTFMLQNPQFTSSEKCYYWIHYWIYWCHVHETSFRWLLLHGV